MQKIDIDEAPASSKNIRRAALDSPKHRSPFAVCFRTDLLGPLVADAADHPIVHSGIGQFVAGAFGIMGAEKGIGPTIIFFTPNGIYTLGPHSSILPLWRFDFVANQPFRLRAIEGQPRWRLLNAFF
jgi:hypothetical protein